MGECIGTRKSSGSAGFWIASGTVGGNKKLPISIGHNTATRPFLSWTETGTVGEISPVILLKEDFVVKIY